MNIKDVRDMNNQEVLVEIRYLLDQIQPIMNRLTQLQSSISETADETKEIPEFPIFNEDLMFAMSAKLRVFGSDKRACTGEYSDYNAFHTKEYADLFASKCKEIAMLLHCKWYLSRDYTPDWCNHAEEKYTVYFDHAKDCWCISIDLCGEYGKVYFETEEKAEKAARWMNTFSR